MKMKFIPVDYGSFDFEGRNYVKITGRDEKGKRICVIDSCDIYFWAILKSRLSKVRIQNLVKKIEKIRLDIKGRKTRVEKVEVHDKKFMGKKVKALKIFATNYKDLHDIADRISGTRFEEIEKRRGYDLGFVSHYIIEKKILPFEWYEIEGEIPYENEFGGICSKMDVDICMKFHSMKKIEKEDFNPKVLAFDIETDEFRIGRGKILMISLVSDGFRKVLTWKNPSKNLKLDFVESVSDESELIERFLHYVKKISPDFLVGYFSDGFDMPYLKARADDKKVKLSIGLDGGQPIFHRGVVMTCRTEGVVHIDLLKFVNTAYSQYMQSETLALNDVAKEFLGDEKKNFKFKSTSEMSENDWKDYFEYNLHDSQLTYDLFFKFWPDMREFSRVMQEPLFEVSRNGMSKNVESYILHNLERFNEIPEKRPLGDEIGKRRMRSKYEGAFVFQPTPGLYEDLAIFDFTSMHASIIVTYNLSRGTLLEKKEKSCTESPEFELDGEKKKFYFSEEKGFFPLLLGEIVKLRKKYKKELKENPDPIKKARSNAFKLLANAYYGYMGFFGARYYSIEAAASTLAFVRQFNKWTIDRVEKNGYNVIFGDTDSVGFALNDRTKEETKQFLKKLNSELPGIMALDLEDFYKRGIWVTKRSGGFGAKKKYALIGENGKMKIRGFETVRRDWCRLARDTQNKVLQMILEDGNEKRALDYVRGVAKRIKSRKITREEILIRTQLKKPISEYKSISPHVIAARRMQEQKIPIDEGALIEYYIAETKEKKKLVRDRVKLANEEGEYDIDYYLKHQILPAVENIFQVFGININTVLEDKKQMTLGEF